MHELAVEQMVAACTVVQAVHIEVAVILVPEAANATAWGRLAEVWAVAALVLLLQIRQRLGSELPEAPLEEAALRSKHSGGRGGL